MWYQKRVADGSSALTVRLVSEAETGWYNELMAEHHSLGVAASGRVLRYAAEMDGVPLVLATFGSAAWRVPVRDEFIGWDPVQRAERLDRVCCNQRLCVLPEAEAVPHAASRALAQMLRRLPESVRCLPPDRSRPRPASRVVRTWVKVNSHGLPRYLQSVVIMEVSAGRPPEDPAVAAGSVWAVG